MILTFVDATELTKTEVRKAEVRC